MKKIKNIAVLASLIAIGSVLANDITLPTTTAYNLRIGVQANGPLDAPPTWQATGLAVLQVDTNSLGALLLINDAGTNVVTITASSQGTFLSSKLIVTVSPRVVPPATQLTITVNSIAK